jgi:hypothetical protein
MHYRVSESNRIPQTKQLRRTAAHNSCRVGSKAGSTVLGNSKCLGSIRHAMPHVRVTFVLRNWRWLLKTSDSRLSYCLKTADCQRFPMNVACTVQHMAWRFGNKNSLFILGSNILWIMSKWHLFCFLQRQVLMYPADMHLRCDSFTGIRHCRFRFLVQILQQLLLIARGLPEWGNVKLCLFVCCIVTVYLLFICYWQFL